MTARVAHRPDGAVRAALSDLYFHSLPLVALNATWGLGVIGIAIAILVWSPYALVLVPLLAVPALGTCRLAARIVRATDDRSYGAALVVSRQTTLGTIVGGIGYGVALIVLASNAVIGLTGTQPLEWILGTLAAWGFVAILFGTIIAIPLLVDPLRAELPVGRRLRVAAAVAGAHPRLVATLGIGTWVFLAASTILVVAILSTGLAISALVACRVVYPRADAMMPPPVQAS